jgi:hypothetical protein
MNTCVTPSISRNVAAADPITFDVDGMLQIIRAEFLEMPGMRLTRAQFRRLWHLSELDCERLVTDLIAIGFLEERAHGAIGRPSEQ